jgi:hypothetical protein
MHSGRVLLLLPALLAPVLLQTTWVVPRRPARSLPPAAITRLTTGQDSSGNATHIHPVSFSPDDKILASAYREIRLGEVATGQELLKFPSPRATCMPSTPLPCPSTARTSQRPGSCHSQSHRL